MTIKRSPIKRTIPRFGLPLLPCACALLVPALQLPQQALAQSTCGAVAPYPATIICDDTSDNPYTDGILLGTSTGLSIHVASGIVIQRSEGHNHDGVGLDGTGNDLLYVYLEDGVSISVRGNSTDGVQVHSASGNSDVVIDSGANIDGLAVAPAMATAGLMGWITDPTSTGEVFIRQRAGGTIHLTGEFATGIWSYQDGLGRSTIVSDGVINAKGADATGMYTGVNDGANAERAVTTLGSQGTITVDGDRSSGIYNWYEGLLGSDINVHGSIEATGVDSDGVVNRLLNAGPKVGTISISDTGSIRVEGTDSRGAIIINEGSGASTILNDGEVTVLGQGSIGLSVEAQGGTASVTSNGTVSASGQGAIGIMSLSEADTSAVTIGAGATVAGGWQPGAALGVSPAVGVAIGSATGSTLTNRGVISAGSDRAIADTSLWIVPPGATGPLTVTNSGTVTGFVDFGFIAGNLFENEAGGLFDIRHFADTDGDGVRDTKRVAITNFGDAASQFNNAGTVRLAPVTGAASVDVASFYVPTTGAASTPLSASDYDFSRDGIVQAQMLNLGAFTNAGIIDLRGPAVGNTLLMTSGASAAAAPGPANFVANGGELRLGTYFSAGVVPGGGTGSLSDVLIVDGTTLGTGATQVSILNRSGPGAETLDNGILVVEVRNKAASAAGAFALNGDFVDAGQPVVIGGIRTYSLHHNGIGADAADGNWYLRSVGLSPNNPIYEDTPSIVRPSIDPSTLVERVGNRAWHNMPDAANENGRMIEREGYWSRLLGMQGRYVPTLSTFGAGFDLGQYGVQVGLDRELHNTEDGHLIGGISATYLGFHGTSGSGTLSAHGLGLGGTLTYYDYSGFYLDAQANVLAYFGDYNSTVVGNMARGVMGTGFSTSLETGYRFLLDDDWSVTPQGQLSYSNVGLNPFVDNFGARVAIDDAQSLELRLGLATEHQQSWIEEDGTTSRLELMAAADYYHEFLGRNAVNLSSTVLESQLASDWVGVSAGATYSWNDDAYSLYGEVGARTSIQNFGQSHELRGNVGLRVKW